jgi:hypothetical protein
VCAGDKELDKDNASVAVVGKGHALTVIEGEALQKYLDQIEVGPSLFCHITHHRSACMR